MYLRRTDGLKGYEEPDQLPTSLNVLWRLAQYGVHYPTSEIRAMAKAVHKGSIGKGYMSLSTTVSTNPGIMQIQHSDRQVLPKPSLSNQVDHPSTTLSSFSKARALISRS